MEEVEVGKPGLGVAVPAAAGAELGTAVSTLRIHAGLGWAGVEEEMVWFVW